MSKAIVSLFLFYISIIITGYQRSLPLSGLYSSFSNDNDNSFLNLPSEIFQVNEYQS